jgi:rubredoxin
MSDFKKYECAICGFAYDEEQGWPEDGIAPGTKWEDVPDDWTCPVCDSSKHDFDMVEV